MKDLRRVVSTVVIGSFSLAALIGILALLSGGDFGETEGRILLTTVVVGTESVALLCYLALNGHRFAVVGVVGAAVSLVAFSLALWGTWGGDDQTVLEVFLVALTIAASLAQASLLLALAGRQRVSTPLLGTLAAIAVVALMITIPVVGDGDVGDGYWRLLGVVAILDALGTVVLTAVAAFRRRPDSSVGLSAEVQQRLVDAARERGTSPSLLVSDALDAYLA
ncbi:MAG TPA: hypothetical protein VM097_03040 [Mycobacteriales bacterium]|nr:hypothetical protein [Mycobacteriales bacterium]